MVSQRLKRATDMLKDSVKILRLLLPQDAKQVLFIVGAVFLFIGALLPWGRRLSIHIPPLLNPVLLQPIGLWIILLSGAAALFLCFRAGTHPARSLVIAVCLPALIGFALEFGFYLYGAVQFSALRNGTPSVGGIVAPLMWIARTATGFHYALAGFSLVGLFTLCVRSGLASLPLTLPSGDFPPTDAVSWRHLCILIWVLITWFPALLAGTLVAAGLAHVPGAAPLLGNAWADAALTYLLPYGSCLALAVWLVGKEVWRTLGRSVKLPKPEMFLMALVLSGGVVLAGLAIDHYLFGRYYVIRSASVNSVVLFLVFVAALCEEAMFRGLLQPWFISRYGILRGILLVSTVWAGAHSWTDFSRISTDAGVLWQLSGRLLGCMAGGLVLGWLALRSRSIWPGVLAHWIYNSLVAPLAPRAPVYYFMLLWMVTAIVLFRYWPIQVDQRDSGNFICAM